MTTIEMATPPAAGPAGGSHPAARYTLWACLAAYALNTLDLQIMGPAMLEIPNSFEVTKAGVVLMGTATLLTSAIGGWLAGGMSDRFGRKRTLQVMIACFAVSTFLCAFAVNFAWLFVMRAFMGIGFGGQWAAAAVMVGEASPPARRGWWVGVMQSGWAIGWGIAELTRVLHPVLPANVFWRGLFVTGGLLPIVLIIWVQRRVKESPVFEATQERFAALDIFSPRMLGTTFFACLLSIGAMGGYYAIVLWLPAFLAGRDLTVQGWVWYLVFLISGAFAGYLASAWLSDRDPFKRRWNFVVFAAGAIVTVFACICLGDERIVETPEVRQGVVLMLAFPLGFFASGTFSGTGAFFTELFPPGMRGSGVGFSYNFGRGFLVLILWLIPWAAGTGWVKALPTSLPQWLSTTPLGLSVGASVLITYLLVIVAALALPETRGRELTATGQAYETGGTRP
jgi:MFS family permease